MDINEIRERLRADPYYVVTGANPERVGIEIVAGTQRYALLDYVSQARNDLSYLLGLVEEQQATIEGLQREMKLLAERKQS